MSDLTFIAVRTLVHLAVATPFNLFQFFLVLGLFQTNFNIIEAFHLQREKIKNAILTGWKFWPLIFISMYRFVPIHLQNAYLDVFAFFFSIILSYIQSGHVSESLPKEVDS